MKFGVAYISGAARCKSIRLPLADRRVKARMSRNEGADMAWMITAGVIVTLAGLVGLVWCVMQALKARRAGLDEDAMRKKLQGLVAWNMGALGLSALGLMMVVAGLLLG